MTKKGPLSKAEKFFIEHKYKDYDSTEEYEGKEDTNGKIPL